MKLALFILTPFEGHGNKSRIYRALSSALELREAGHEVAVVFDGAGTEALGQMTAPEHPFHKHLEAIRGIVAGACAGCAKAYGTLEAITKAGFALLRDHRGEASVAKYVNAGYQVITY